MGEEGRIFDGDLAGKRSEYTLVELGAGDGLEEVRKETRRKRKRARKGMGRGEKGRTIGRRGIVGVRELPGS